MFAHHVADLRMILRIDVAEIQAVCRDWLVCVSLGGFLCVGEILVKLDVVTHFEVAAFLIPVRRITFVETENFLFGEDAEHLTVTDFRFAKTFRTTDYFCDTLSLG